VGLYSRVSQLAYLILIIGSLSFSFRLWAPSFGGHASPNEWNPQDAKEIWAQSQQGGVYVAVGSERAFIGAAQSNADQLLMVDMDLGVVLFNETNRALIAVAKNREDYLHLRLHSTQAEWIDRANASGLPENLTVALRNPDHFNSWLEGPRNIYNRHFKRFQSRPTADSPYKSLFKGVNYLWDDAAFAKLSKMARENKIKIIQAELDKEDGVAKLKQSMSEMNSPICVFDMSNAWHKQYIEYDHLIRLFRMLEANGTPRSLLLLTNYPSKKTTESYAKELGAFPSVWDYYGYTFDNIFHTSGGLEWFWLEKTTIRGKSPESYIKTPVLHNKGKVTDSLSIKERIKGFGYRCLIRLRRK
jgi:hypothetical protein